MFLVMYCDRLQGLFTSPHSLSVIEAAVLFLEKLYTQSTLRTAAQDNQYIVDYAHPVNEY